MGNETLRRPRDNILPMHPQACVLSAILQLAVKLKMIGCVLIQLPGLVLMYNTRENV